MGEEVRATSRTHLQQLPPCAEGEAQTLVGAMGAHSWNPHMTLCKVFKPAGISVHGGHLHCFEWLTFPQVCSCFQHLTLIL